MTKSELKKALAAIERRLAELDEERDQLLKHKVGNLAELARKEAGRGAGSARKGEPPRSPAGSGNESR